VSRRIFNCATGQFYRQKALFHSNLHVSQTPPQIIHTLFGRLVSPDFLMNCAVA